MGEGILIDTAGVECCCEPPLLFDTCPHTGSLEADSCPDEIFPSVTGRVVQNWNSAGTELISSFSADWSFTTPWVKTFLSGFIVWILAPGDPPSGVVGTFTRVRLVGDSGWEGTTCLTAGVISPDCLAHISEGRLGCSTDSEWKVLFDFGVDNVAASFSTFWTSIISGCPGGGWSQQLGQCPLPGGGGCISSSGTVTV